MAYADERGNREFPVTSYTEIEWDVKKTGDYFKKCQAIYEDFLRMSDGLIKKFEAFENDITHTGPEADSSKAFVKECENPLIVDITDNVQQIEDLQVKLMAAFAENVDKSETAIVKTTHLKKIISDYIGYEASLKGTGDKIKNLVQELRAECSAVGSYTEPEYKSSHDAMKQMTTEDGSGGLVPKLQDAFLTFDNNHRNDVKNSDFRALYLIIVDNIKKFMAGIGDGRFYDIRTYNDTRDRLDWTDPKDELTGVALDEYKKYIRDMEEYLKGMKERCEVYKYDPVNMCSGNYINEQDDISIGGRYGIIFHRFYNAISDDIGVLGKGWTHSFETRLEEIEDGIRIYYPDGSKGIYRKDKEKDFYYEEHGEPGTLTKDDGGYLIKSDSGDYKRFDKAGYLVAEGSFDEEKRTFEYDKYTGIRKLVQIKTPNGACLKLDYDENGRLGSLTDHTGRRVCYAYDENGYLCEITFADGRISGFTYYENGLIKDAINPDGVVCLTNEYDEKRRTIRQTFPDGGVMTYEYDDEKRTTTATEQNGNKVIYTHDKLGRHIKTEYYDGTETFRYNNRNQKTAYTDKNGNTTRYAYDNRGHLTKYIDPKGNVTSITYFANGMPATVKGAKGETYKFSYDNEGHLFEVKNPLGENNRFYYKEGKLKKIKDALGNVTEMQYDENGNLSATIDADGVRSEYEYDELGRVIVKTEGERGQCSFSYNASDKVTSIINQLGDSREYTYNSTKKVTKVDEVDGTTTRFEYNELGKITVFTDRDGRNTKFHYNNMWKVDRISLPNGGILKYDYDAHMRVKRFTDPNGRYVDYEYDPNGNVIRISIDDKNLHLYEYDECNRLVKETDALGRTVLFAYDANGKVIEATDSNGNITKQNFDVLGRIIKTIDPLGRATDYSYTKTGKVESITDHEGRKTAFNYTKGGRISSIISCGEIKQKISYDKKGRMNALSFQDGYSINYEYDEIGRVKNATGSDGRRVEYTYDPMGRVLSVSDNGKVTEYTYTPTGMIKSIKDAEGNEAFYEYDSMNKLIRIERTDNNTEERFPSVSDFGHVTVYEYDLSGQMIRQVDALGQEEKYFYDQYGMLVRKTDRDGYDTEYEYDLVGDIEKVIYADGRSVEFTHNNLGHIDKIIDWTGITKVERDSIGRIEKIIDPKDRVIEYTYGLSDEKTSITYPDGRKINYIYDDKARISEIVDGINRTTYDYDDNGRLAKKILPNNVEVMFSYLPGGYLKEMISKDNIGIIDSYTYTYDEFGRRSDIERHRRNLENVSGEYHYDYDNLGRLKDVRRNDELIRSYTYDGYGNRRSLKEGGNIIKYTYDALDRLVSSEKNYPESNVCEITAYNYDRRGNIKEIQVNGDCFKKFRFDETNMMTWGYDKKKGEASYVYNGLGKRVAVKTPEEEIEYILDITKAYNDMLCREINGEKENFVYDKGIISINREGEDYYYLLDELGSTMYLTGTDGSIVSDYAYDEFGKAVDPFTGKGRRDNNRHYCKQGNIIQPYSFAGYQEDEITGNYYAQARYYNADAGRFISRDRDIFMSVDDPESMNLYAYCQNSPIELFDPTGNKEIPWYVQVYIYLRGNEAHKLFENYAKNLDPKHVTKNYPIEGASFHGKGQYGFADFVVMNDDESDVQIYEIKGKSYKPGNAFHDLGVNQLENYVNVYNNNTPDGNPARRGDYNECYNVTLKTTHEKLTGYCIEYTMYPDEPGMVYYEYRKIEDGEEFDENGVLIPKQDDDDISNSGGGGGEILEFKQEKKKDNTAAIVAIVVGIVIIALVVIAFVFGGEILAGIAAIGAAIAEFIEGIWAALAALTPVIVGLGQKIWMFFANNWPSIQNFFTTAEECYAH